MPPPAVDRDNLQGKREEVGQPMLLSPGGVGETGQ